MRRANLKTNGMSFTVGGKPGFGGEAHACVVGMQVCSCVSPALDPPAQTLPGILANWPVLQDRSILFNYTYIV